MLVKIPRRITPQMREVEERFGNDLPIADLISRTILEHGEIKAAAEALGITRQTLYAWLARLNIRHEFDTTV